MNNRYFSAGDCESGSGSGSGSGADPMVNAISPLVSDYVDDEEYMELVRAYAADLPRITGSIAAGFRARDWEQAKVLSHQLRGSGGMHGYALLSELGAQLEMSAIERDGAFGQRLLEELAVLCRRVYLGLPELGDFRAVDEVVDVDVDANVGVDVDAIVEPSRHAHMRLGSEIPQEE